MPSARGDTERKQQTYEKPVANNSTKQGALRSAGGSCRHYEASHTTTAFGDDTIHDEAREYFVVRTPCLGPLDRPGYPKGCGQRGVQRRFTGKLLSNKLATSYEAYHTRHLQRNLARTKPTTTNIST